MRPTASLLIMTPVFLFSSCKKIIDLKLNEAALQVVIEGVVNNQPGPYFVIVSKSKHFTDSIQYSTIDNATVIISDDLGDIDTLSEAVNGVYQTHTIAGVEGRTYTLMVYSEGKQYTSICKMPFAVAFDTLYSASDPTTTSGYALIPVYHDPPGISNYYRFNAFEGSDHVPIIRVRNDKSTDGTTVSLPVGFDNYFNPGDSATLELWGIDEKVYEYFFGLGQTLSQGLNAPASPGNPSGNITGGCLGFFSAHTIQRRSILIR